MKPTTIYSTSILCKFYMYCLGMEYEKKISSAHYSLQDVFVYIIVNF